MIFYHLYYRILILKLNWVLSYPNLTKCIIDTIGIHNVQLYIDYKIASAIHPDVFWYPLNGIKWASKSQSKGHAFSFWRIIFLPNLEHLEYYIPSIGCDFGCFSSTGSNLPHPITASVPPFLAGGQLLVPNFEMGRSEKNEFLGEAGLECLLSKKKKLKLKYGFQGSISRVDITLF